MTSKTIIIDGVEGVWTPGISKARRWQVALDALEPDKPAGAWGRTGSGRAGSKSEVAYNASKLSNTWYPERVKQAASEFDLPFPLLMGIFDRESNHGRSLKNGYGDNGHGFGVGQVDSRYHEQRGKPDPYALDHMRQCCEILSDYLGQVEKKHPDWADKYLLKGAVVAYNSGVSNVVTINGMDQGTTGNDYGADVCARAQYWQMLLGK